MFQIFDLTLVDVEKPGLDIETISGGECSEEDRVRRKDNVTLHYTARLAADGIHPGLYSNNNKNQK